MTNLAFGRSVAYAATAMIVSAGFAIAEPANPECIAPAQPGGGFDITCKLAQAALTDAAVLADPLRDFLHAGRHRGRRLQHHRRPKAG